MPVPCVRRGKGPMRLDRAADAILFGQALVMVEVTAMPYAPLRLGPFLWHVRRHDERQFGQLSAVAMRRTDECLAPAIIEETRGAIVHLNARVIVKTGGQGDGKRRCGRNARGVSRIERQRITAQRRVSESMNRRSIEGLDRPAKKTEARAGRGNSERVRRYMNDGSFLLNAAKLEPFYGSSTAVRR